MKKIILPALLMAIGFFTVTSCSTEEDYDPCEGWYVGVDWEAGVNIHDLDGDGFYETLTYVSSDTSITVSCSEDLNGDCIPDCFEPYIYTTFPGPDDGTGGGGSGGGGSSDSTSCANWWVGLTLIPDASFDYGSTGAPTSMTHVYADTSSASGISSYTFTCIDDANLNCIPDCYEPYITP